VNYTLDDPQVLEYEKTYWPFCIISKKRYVGNLYAFSPDYYYQSSMGLVTKRRDNADIVKVVVGGIIDQILNKRDPEGAIKFTQSRLKRIITGQYGMEKFTITKTLKEKEDYKDWTRMVHMVVADRMAVRDPGNKPQANDRLPFAFIETKKKVKLQGERAEHPVHVLKNNMKLDYLYYITNQIMKPALQFLELLCENPDDVFHQYIVRETHRKNGQTPIMKLLQDCERDHNDMRVNFGGRSLLQMMEGEYDEIKKLKSKSKSKKRKNTRTIRKRVARKRIV
jgi:DNA polymerase elongation subunit (family B)